MRRSALALGVAVSLAGAAGAAPLPDYAKDSLGEWLVATDDGKPGCRIVLSAEAVAGGWRAVPKPDCAARLPAVSRVVAWRYDSGVKLLEAGGTVGLDFGEDETTLMKTGFETPPVHFLVRAKPGVERAPFAPALAGAWVLRRPGGPVLCPLTLARGANDGATELTLKTGAPCDPAVARLKLNSARAEDYTLMLYGRPETSLKFEPSGPETFAKAEAGRPLELARP